MTAPVPGADPVRAVFRRALRDVLVLTLVVTVLGTVIGGVLLGAPGVWGGVVGGLIGLLTAAATPVTMLKTAAAPLLTAMLAMVAAWVAKSLVVLGSVALLRDSAWFDGRVLFAVAAAALLGSVIVDARAVQGGRVPYVTPADGPTTAGTTGSPDSSSGREA